MLPGTLKAKPESHDLMEIEVTPMNTSKQPSRKYLTPSSFLTLKGKLTSLNNQEFSLSKTTRKYFGHKTRLPSNSSKAASIRNYFRYFTKVSFEEIKGNGNPLPPIKAIIKSLGSLGVPDKPFMVNTGMRFAERILSVCPCKVSIVSDESQNAKWWLSLSMPIASNIKHLKLELSNRDHSQLLKRPNLFQSFTNLESCCLNIEYRKSEPPIVDFLPALCQTQSLKSLELDLSRAEIPRGTLTTVLKEITRYEPSRWRLRARMDESRPIEIDKLKDILNKLDFLGLDASHTFVCVGEGDADIYGYEHNPTAALSQMEHLTQKRKRILDLTFEDGSARYRDLKPLLDNCTSLKGIYIRSTGPCFRFDKDLRGIVDVEDDDEDEDENGDGNEQESEEKDEDEDEMENQHKHEDKDKDKEKDANENEDEDEDEDEMKNENQNKIQNKNENENDKIKPWASNLEDAVFSFNSNYQFDYTPKDLIPIVQNQSLNLRFFEVFCCSSRETYACDQEWGEDMDLGRSDEIEMCLEGFDNILLEELKLTINGKDIEKLKLVLKGLTNLKKLHLVLGVDSKDQNPWDSSFPFEDCTNLQELRITINPDMKTLPWGKDFTKNCHYLQNLRVLEIHDHPISLRVFCSLVKRLMDLKNLRKLIFQTKVPSEVTSQEIPEDLDELMKLNLNASLEKLKSQVKSFIHSNRNLEELNIGKLEGFSFEHFKYA